MVLVSVSILHRIQPGKVGAGFEARRFDSNLAGLRRRASRPHGPAFSVDKFNLESPGGQIDGIQMEPDL